MGRVEERKQAKRVKSKLTDDQFQELKNQFAQQRIQEGIDRFIGNFVAVFKPVMQEYKISSERADKVIKEIYDRAWDNYLKGEPGEERPQEHYLDEHKFMTAAIKVFTPVLPKESLNELIEELYKEVLKAARGEEL